MCAEDKEWGSGDEEGCSHAANAALCVLLLPVQASSRPAACNWLRLAFAPLRSWPFQHQQAWCCSSRS
eukprot:scaffold225331_cov19-Tisochrysis_lutea.AAC.2